MSAICQTFVQNTWRKDLCSNCFKSQEEHGNNHCEISFTSLPPGEDGRTNDVNKTGRGSGRYMGVAGSVYQRSYYNKNSWKSIMIDNTDSALKSPGLIKGMSNFIRSENEKNLALSNTTAPPNNDNSRSSGIYQHQVVKTAQSEAKLLSDFLDDNHEKEKDKGDLSSDLGSDADHDVSNSSASSHSSAGTHTSDVTSGGASSDTASLKSDQGSEHLEEYHLRSDLEVNFNENFKENFKETVISDIQNVSQISKQKKKEGILKESRLAKSHQKNIIWNSEDQTIGYGGDVDYSDDEEYSDDDDDDCDEDDEIGLTPDERVLKRLTERNTIFNEENENLLKDGSDLKTVPCIRYEALNKTYNVDSEHEIEGGKADENRISENCESIIQGERKEEKLEPKVKLRRSPPLSSSIKPLISRNLNDIKVNQVLPMKNGEVIRPTLNEKDEIIPLKGIKPKYVSIEDEMVEKFDHNDLISKQKEKLTSIDDVISDKKITSIDDVISDKKITSIDDIVPNDPTFIVVQKTTSLDEVIPCKTSLYKTDQQDFSTNDKSKVNELIKYNDEAPENIKYTANDNTNRIKEDTIAQEELRKKSPDIQLGSSKVPVVPKPRQSKIKKVNNIPERRNTTTNKIMKFIQDDFRKSNSLERNYLDSSLPEIQTNIVKNGVENENIEINTFHQTSISPNQEVSEFKKRVEEVVISDQLTSENVEKKSLNMSPGIEEMKNVDSNLTPIEDNDSHRSSSSQESFEHSKTPASRQNSSSSFTTFGTPVVMTTSTPQNSFLHQNSRGSMYDEIYGTTKSPIYTPAKDFLKEIKSHPEVSTPTAGISKSALYASTSCLKGLPIKKPVLTPKPPILKEKPKFGYKTSVNANRIYATPSPLVPKLAMGNLSSSVSSPSLLNVSGSEDKDSRHSLSGISNSPYNSHSDSRLNLQDSITHEYKKPPPTTHAPAIPTTPTHSNVEAVYDVPVTLNSNPVIVSQTVTTNISIPKINDEVIYQDVEEVLKAKLAITQSKYKNEENAYQVSDVSLAPAIPTSSPPALSPIVSSVERQESTRCQSRSTFEANRSLLSAALSFGSNSIRSSTNKRLAPLPPEEEDIYQNESNQKDSSDKLSQRNSFDTNTPKDKNFIQIPDNRDGESYSSFTDDFDDDDEDYEDEDDQPTLKKTERSSSANPFYRNSIGPIHQYSPAATSGTTYGTSNVYVIPTGAPLSESSGKIATRSHSVPRVSEHIIKKNVIITPVSVSSTSTSKFSFGKSGFFQPSSSTNTKSDKQERGRDRSKKSSRFSLKKLLRIGSKEEDKKNVKLENKQAEREAKKHKLQIIHPLDYNQNGVEVIARPEKTSPIYDYTGIYGYLPPPKQKKEEDIYAAVSTVTQLTNASPVLSRYSYHSEDHSQEPTVASFSLSPTPSIASSQPSTSSSQPISSFFSLSPSSTSITNSTETNMTPILINSDSVPQTQKHLEKRNSFFKKEDISSRGIERRESLTSHNSGTQSQIHLGYNSEGRPKPPPPPRKVSIEGGLSEESPLLEVYSVSRPLRPPPPTRTPSNAGTKSGPPRPDSAKLTRDSVYANIGDVRAPFTPRKPGRSASIRGEDDREKRKAPQPPSSSSSSTRSSISSLRGSSKGPAPLRPQRSDQTPTSDGATESATNIYDSTLSSQKEKTSRVSVRRSSAVTHRSLEDQYGAVVSANHEALNNMFDQISSYVCPPGMDELLQHVLRWSDVRLNTNSDTAYVGAGYRMFYQGSVARYNVTIMVTPESNVEAHHLLTPLPISSFKDELPSNLLSNNNISRRDTISATVWILPPLNLATLQEVSEEQQELLTSNPEEWKRRTCLLLLQLVTGLKQLQAQGLEETCIDFALVSRGQIEEGQDHDVRLILIPPVDSGGFELVSLCQMASLTTLMLLGVETPLTQVLGGAINLPYALPSQNAFKTLLRLLHQEKAGSLTQVKCLLELLLYGPDEMSMGSAGSLEEVESMMQRWLDLERANVLQSLITKPLKASINIKYHLLFLVRSNARTLRDSVKLLEDADMKFAVL